MEGINIDIEGLPGWIKPVIQVLTWLSHFVETPFGIFCVQVVTVFAISEFLIRMPVKQATLLYVKKNKKEEEFIYNTAALAGNLFFGIFFATIINWGKGFRGVAVLSCILIAVSLILHKAYIIFLEYLKNRKNK
jgi:hypothetical protein